MPRLHLSCVQIPADRGKKEKARFCLRENYFYYIRNFTFYILHLSFARARGRQFCHPERSGERKPRAAQSNGSLTFAPLSFRPRRHTVQHALWDILQFAPLSFRPRRHTPMLSAFCRLAKRSTCKATPPLPKNLASLRFSGALFNSPPSGEILRGAYQKTHAFPIMPSPFLRGKVARAACCA